MFSFVLYMTVFVITLVNINFLQKMDSRYCVTLNGKKINESIIWNLFIGMFFLAPLILTYGCRSLEVGVDSETYSQYFTYFRNLNVLQIWNTYVEPGYLLLIKFADYIGNSVITLQLLCGVIFFITCLVAIKKQLNRKDWSFAFFILLMTSYAIVCNATRQMIAASIILYGIQYIDEKKFLRYFLCVIIAMTFHKTAILALLFYLFAFDISKKVRNKILMFSVTMSVFVIFLWKIVYIVLKKIDFYAGYLDRIVNVDYKQLICLLYIFPEILLIYYLCKQSGCNDKQRIYGGIFYLQLPFQVLQIYSENIARISWYFAIIRVIIVPMLIRDIEDKRKRFLWYSVMIFWYLFYYIIMFVILNGHRTYPYKFYFQ